MELTLIQKFVLFAPPLILAITLHEVAHGYVAKLFGDRTAEMMGRLTLNPIKHIDPVGTILVPAMILMLSSVAGQGFIFGWAKPVPINTRNLKKPRQHMAWIATAGPASNIVMAILWAIVLRVAVEFDPALGWPKALFLMAQFGVVINVFLAVLNMIPIPPLDGGRVAVGLLPMRQAMQLERLERFGFMIILVLIATPAFNAIIPVVRAVMGMVLAVVGLS